MRHCSSIFGQVVSLIPRGLFAQRVRERASERNSKGFSSWTQFVAMLFCQLAQAKSLREICHGLCTCVGKLIHLGLAEAPKRSTLAYANAHRPWQLFQDVYFDLFATCRSAFPGKKKKFRFRNKLYSLDASVIDLCASVFDWAKYRLTKGAVKLHMLLDHDGYLPTFVHITHGRVHDVQAARLLDLPEGSIVAMDRGYVHYALFGRWTEGGVWFVTRAKRGMKYRVIEKRRVPQGSAVLLDQVIRLTSDRGLNGCPYPLRRIVVWDERRKEVVVLLTNHLGFGATTISAIYKDRWEIELFFKALKQHLKVKTFVGTSSNALHIQIWTALIAMLLLKYMQFRSTYGWSLSNLVALLRWNLFVYRDLHEWLNDPFAEPPEPAPYTQPLLPFLDSRPKSPNPLRR